VKKILDKIKTFFANHMLLWTFANLLLFVLVAVMFYKYLRHFELIDQAYETMVQWVTMVLLESASWVLSWFGYESTVEGTILKMQYGGVNLLRGCIGRYPLLVFIVIVMASPKLLKQKMVATAIGLVILNIANIGRITWLAIIQQQGDPEVMDFNHHFVMDVIWVVLIGGLLWWWFSYYFRRLG